MGVATKSKSAFGVWACVAVLVAASAPARAQADDYPSRPITLLVPFAPGGSSDVVMRLVSKRVSESLKQTIVIDNRPGGAGNVAAMAIKNAPKDGYTLMMGHTGTHAINATLYPDLKFDPVKDFSPITPLISFNNILIVNAGSPAKSAKELVALGEVEAGRSDLCVAGRRHRRPSAGRDPRKADRHQADPRAVSRRRAGGDRHGRRPRRSDVLVLCDGGAAYRKRQAPHAGDCRREAASASFRSCRPWREAGFPGVEMEQWFGLFGPAGMPEPVVRKLNVEFVKALQSDEVQEHAAAAGLGHHPGHAAGPRGDGRARHRAARAGGEGIRRQAGVIVS